MTEIILPNTLNCPFVPDIDGAADVRHFCIKRYHPFQEFRPLVGNAVRTVVFYAQSEGLHAKVYHGAGLIERLVSRQPEQAQGVWRWTRSLVAHTQT